jgi:GNAT superfamily N-acetyltransferase
MLVSKRIDSMSKWLDEMPEGNYVYDDGIIKAILTMGQCRDEDKQDAFELMGIYVEPLMKRQGIGRTMAKFCEETALARGYNEICLWVLEENTDSRLFYEAMGYKVEGKRQYLDFLKAYAVRYIKIL